MANWDNPTNTTSYLDVLSELKARDVDALTLLETAGTNIPEHAIRFVRQSNNKVDIEEWNGSSWVTKLVSTDSGGFDSGGASLGTMASQNSNDVTITGGNIAAGVLSGTIGSSHIPNLPASRINSGTFNSSRIPNLSASKVNSGEFGVARIPNLSASKINSGTFNVARLPGIASDLGGIARPSPSADQKYNIEVSAGGSVSLVESPFELFAYEDYDPAITPDLTAQSINGVSSWVVDEAGIYTVSGGFITASINAALGSARIFVTPSPDARIDFHGNQDSIFSITGEANRSAAADAYLFGLGSGSVTITINQDNTRYNNVIRAWLHIRRLFDLPS